MRQKPVPHNAFFSLIADSPQKRPVSVATDIVDTDWDEDDNGQDDIIYDDLIISDEDISPRASIRSVCIYILRYQIPEANRLSS